MLQFQYRIPNLTILKKRDPDARCARGSVRLGSELVGRGQSTFCQGPETARIVQPGPESSISHIRPSLSSMTRMLTTVMKSGIPSHILILLDSSRTPDGIPTRTLARSLSEALSIASSLASFLATRLAVSSRILGMPIKAYPVIAETIKTPTTNFGSIFTVSPRSFFSVQIRTITIS